MLMTVLKGDLAVHQSKTLIRVLQALKDYVVETQGIVTQRDILRLSIPSGCIIRKPGTGEKYSR